MAEAPQSLTPEQAEQIRLAMRRVFDDLKLIHDEIVKAAAQITVAWTNLVPVFELVPEHPDDDTPRCPRCQEGAVVDDGYGADGDFWVKCGNNCGWEAMV